MTCLRKVREERGMSVENDLAVSEILIRCG